jgi:hypothetical protein
MSHVTSHPRCVAGLTEGSCVPDLLDALSEVAARCNLNCA